MKLIMTKGLPASGKSTWAKKFISDNPRYKRVNKDDLRDMIDGGSWSKENEKFIVAVRNALITQALNLGYSVIVDDTNLDPKHEDALCQLAKLHNAVFEVKDFTNIPLEECLKRDSERLLNSVGDKVIRSMYNKYLKPTPVEPLKDNIFHPQCIICDIDGTIAERGERNPYDMSRVHEDAPRKYVLACVTALAWVTKARVLFVSGRDDVGFPATYKWLNDNYTHPLGVPEWCLYTRVKGDKRRDSIVKREIYDQHIKDKYNVVAIFDDRPQVIRECWRALGYGDRIFNVGTGEEF